MGRLLDSLSGLLAAPRYGLGLLALRGDTTNARFAMSGRIDPDQRPKRKEVVITENAVRMRDGRKNLAEGDTIQVVDSERGPRLIDPKDERTAGRRDMQVKKVVEGGRLPNGERARHYIMEPKG